MPRKEAERESIPMPASEPEPQGEAKRKRRVIRRPKATLEDREKTTLHLYPDTVERVYLARRRLGLTRDQFAEKALLALAKTVDYSVRNEVRDAKVETGGEDEAAA